MLLELEDVKRFLRLQSSLLHFVNERLQVLPDEFNPKEHFSSHPPELRQEVHDAFIEHTELIQVFVDENPAQLGADDLEIVHSWRHLVVGRFFVLRKMAKHTVFLSVTQPVVAYGVLALVEPFEDLLGPHLPVLAETVLLPFEGKIVYDGLMFLHNISFGPGARRNLNEDLKEAKARHGIVTSLPMSNEPLPRKASKPKRASRSPLKEVRDEALQVVLGLIDEFCKEYLNDEYALLCRRLAEKLGRKRPSPLLEGSPNAWASGIVRAIGGVNFLHDKSQIPYMRSSDIDHCLGTSRSSGAAKLAAIRHMFGMRSFDPDWTLPSRYDRNPLAWLLQVNGQLTDIRSAPREVQEIALRKGLIPYIPAND